MNGKVLIATFAAANAAWTIAVIAAPLALAPGTVVGLDGRANFIDHAEQWRSLPDFAGLVYWVGDLQCHQMADRSWTLAGNQLPIDVRMFAGFVFGNIGLLGSLRVRSSPTYRDAAAQSVPRVWRARLDSPQRRFAWLGLLWFVAIVPAGVEVVAQMVSDYESTNLNRFVTGALLGVIGGFLTGALLDSRATRGLSTRPAPD